MKTTFKHISIALVVSLFTSCMGTMDNVSISTNEGTTETEIENGIVLSFGNQQNTKLEYNDAMQIVWSEGDVMGVYAKNGHEFPNKPYAITEGVGKNVAYFANNSIIWTPNHEVNNPEKYSFYFYYPYMESSYTQSVGSTYTAHMNLKVALPSQQYQSEANNSKHFSQYRMLASYKDSVWVTEGANVVGGFTFASVVSVFEFIPSNLADGQKIVSITLNGSEASEPFAFEKGILNLEAFKQGENPLNIINGSKNLTLNIGNGGIGNGESAYMVVAPGNAGKEYSISYTTNDGKTFNRVKKGGNTIYTSKAAGYKADVRYIFKIEEAQEVVNAPIRLDARGRANSYVAQRPLTKTSGNISYSFNAQFEGNSNDQVGTTSSVKDKEIDNVTIIWGKTRIDAASVRLSEDKTTIFFDTKYHSDGNGNGVIAVRNKNNQILWSWHIWITDYNPYTDNVTVDGKTFMDRNLGADSFGNNAKAVGLFYQWGRKDPFTAGNGSGTKASAADYTAAELVDLSIANPTVFYYNPTATLESGWKGSNGNQSWGVEKTKFDPCPAGWRVPEDGALNFLKNEGATYEQNAVSYENFMLVAAGSLTQLGTYGHYYKNGFYWSCNAKDDNTSFYTYVRAISSTDASNEVKSEGNIGDDNVHNRTSGFPVRCIAE